MKINVDLNLGTDFRRAAALAICFTIFLPLATGFVIATVMVMPLTGFLARMFGQKRVYLYCLVLFGVVGLCEGVLFTKNIVHFISHSEAVREAAFMPMRMMGIVTPIIAVPAKHCLRPCSKRRCGASTPTVIRGGSRRPPTTSSTTASRRRSSCARSRAR